MNSVIKGASYVLAHTPQMVVYNGTTQTTERIVNPESEYLKELEGHLRSYEDCVNYWPNQVYIGNAHPDELAEVEFPYYDKVKERAPLSTKIRTPLFQSGRDCLFQSLMTIKYNFSFRKASVFPESFHFCEMFLFFTLNLNDNCLICFKPYLQNRTAPSFP